MSRAPYRPHGAPRYPCAICADGQGNAQISWTPTQSGWYDLTVYGTTKDGVQLAPYDYYFTVN